MTAETVTAEYMHITCMKCETAILFKFQTCSSYCTVLQMKNTTRRVYAINAATKELQVWTILMIASCTEAMTGYTYMVVEKEIEHKEGKINDACILAAVVGEKASLNS